MIHLHLRSIKMENLLRISAALFLFAFVDALALECIQLDRIRQVRRLSNNFQSEMRLSSFYQRKLSLNFSPLSNDNAVPVFRERFFTGGRCNTFLAFPQRLHFEAVRRRRNESSPGQVLVLRCRSVRKQHGRMLLSGTLGGVTFL